MSYNIKTFHFSGKFGDPGMCKDLKEIVEYIINSNDTSTISINTNGSMRDEDFWFSLGLLGKERIHIIFDVDGIDQKMHEFYRRGTNLKKVLSNLEATCQTLAKVSVLTVMFKHNENYIEDIQNMCRKLGVKNFDTVEGIVPRKKIRIRTYGTDNFISSKNQYSLEIKLTTEHSRFKKTNLNIK